MKGLQSLILATEAGGCAEDEDGALLQVVLSKLLRLLFARIRELNFAFGSDLR